MRSTPDLRPRETYGRVDGGVASALVEQAEGGIALRARQVVGADVRHGDPDRIGNAARAIVADRAVFEELLVGRKCGQDRLRQPLEGAPGEGADGKQTGQQCDDRAARGAPIAGPFHALPGEIETDRLW